jgi:ribonucleoside-diphosphate reductase alpha chain
MLSENAEKLLKQRYYMPGENWEGLVSRVHNDNILGDEPEYYSEVYNDMLTLKFLPNSPCLVNSGKPNAGKQACFVVGPTEDTLEDHFETLKDIAEVAKRGGGCGFTGSFIRYEGAKVNGSSHGYAYGPLKYAELVSKGMHMMTQSGFRGMALMVTLDCEHPNIEDFINLKKNRQEGDLYNFNQSMMTTDEFMQKAVSNDTSKEAALLYKLALNAWSNGEPGLLFSDTINNNTPYKEAGEKIYATNPCGHR